MVMRTVSPGAGPERRVANPVDVAADPTVAEHRRLERVFAVDGSRLGGGRLGRDSAARAGAENDQENEENEGRRGVRRDGGRMLHGAVAPAVGYQILEMTWPQGRLSSRCLT